MKHFLMIFVASMAVIQAGTLEFVSTSKEIQAPASVTSVDAEFDFTNRTEKAVTITKSDPGCSCVAVKVSGGKLRVEPGESGKIQAKFDMGNFSGTVDKVILIWLDDAPADQPSAVLKLKVVIPVLVGLEPKTLQWDLAGPTATRTIEIKMAGKEPIRVSEVKTSSENFILELKTIEVGKIYQLLVTPKDVCTPGLGVFRIITDCSIKKHQIQQAFGVVRKSNSADTASKP
jgi:Protein of unknown function (DUF1573)